MNKKRRSIPKEHYQKLVHGISVNNDSANEDLDNNISAKEDSVNQFIEEHSANSENNLLDSTFADVSEEMTSEAIVEAHSLEKEIIESVRSIEPVEVKEESNPEQTEEPKISAFNQLGNFLLSVWGYWLFPILILLSAYI